ncbi:hypothetical protein BKA93DRAFT_752713 [Sparassis latifolia]
MDPEAKFQELFLHEMNAQRSALLENCHSEHRASEIPPLLGVATDILEDTGKETWIWSQGGKQLWDLKSVRVEGDTDLIVIEEPASSEQAISLYISWYCAQLGYNRRSEPGSELVKTQQWQSPIIILMSSDPRGWWGEKKNLLEHLFDFFHVPTKFCHYDSMLEAQQRELKIIEWNTTQLLVEVYKAYLEPRLSKRVKVVSRVKRPSQPASQPSIPYSASGLAAGTIIHGSQHRCAGRISKFTASSKPRASMLSAEWTGASLKSVDGEVVQVQLGL